MIVIQLVVVVAVHEHDVPEMTLSVCVDAVPPTLKLVGFRLYEHCASAIDPPATQISTASPQHRAMFMAAPRIGPGQRPARLGNLHGASRRDGVDKFLKYRDLS